MNPDLVRAIVEKRLVEFVYRSGQPRSVEPHDYGIRGDRELLLAYQISGESRSGTPEGWKHFEVAQLRELKVLDLRFAGSREDQTQRHGRWDRLFARVAP